MGINYYLRGSRNIKVIYVQIRNKGKKYRIGTPLQIKEKDWNKKTNLPKNTIVNNQIISNQLSKLSDFLLQQFQQGNENFKLLVGIFFSGGDTTVLPLFDMYINKIEGPANKAKYKTIKLKIEAFEKEWKFVSSHICRRSFATNFYGKIPTPLLINVTGHSSENMFLTYIGKKGIDQSLELAKMWG